MVLESEIQLHRDHKGATEVHKEYSLVVLCGIAFYYGIRTANAKSNCTKITKKTPSFTKSILWWFFVVLHFTMALELQMQNPIAQRSQRRHRASQRVFSGGSLWYCILPWH
jgi:hypothetical protein